MTDTQDLSPLKAARRDKILDTAEALFVREGHRGVTMEGLAEAVGMSKATVYGYFGDKDAVFVAVADRVATRLKVAVTRALDGDGTGQDRITAALIAKHGVIFDLVRASPFSKDLFSANARLSETRFAHLDRDIEALISAALASEGRTREDAKRIAHLLFAASQGIANASASHDAMARDVATLVRAFFALEQAS